MIHTHSLLFYQPTSYMYVQYNFLPVLLGVYQTPGGRGWLGRVLAVSWVENYLPMGIKVSPRHSASVGRVSTVNTPAQIIGGCAVEWGCPKGVTENWWLVCLMEVKDTIRFPREVGIATSCHSPPPDFSMETRMHTEQEHLQTRALDLLFLRVHEANRHLKASQLQASRPKINLSSATRIGTQVRVSFQCSIIFKCRISLQRCVVWFSILKQSRLSCGYDHLYEKWQEN